jgi:DNA-binding response OmpR family regulator
MMTNISTDAGQKKGRLLIVDDDPVVAGMLGVSLGKYGFEVSEVESGEDCLDRIAAIRPDAVLLDIEMPGIDGYETCRRLRERPDTQYLPIIFLSGRDGLDDRLLAYDAGADDFVAKPFDAEEVRRKADIAVRINARREKMSSEKSSADSTTMTALTSLGETGIVLKFTRSSLSCRSLQALATLAVDSLRAYGIESHVQIRSRFGTMTLTPDGPASPLEASVIEQSQGQGRIFQFKRRMIVNYDSISILVRDMPVDDADAAGRIRDYAAMICETGEAAVDNILLRIEANTRADELRRLAEATRTAIGNLHARYSTQQVDTRFELERMISTLENMYTSLGLTDNQEFAISNVVRHAQENVMKLFEQGAAFDGEFKSILEALARAADYILAVEDEQPAPAEIDLW